MGTDPLPNQPFIRPRETPRLRPNDGCDFKARRNDSMTYVK